MQAAVSLYLTGDKTVYFRERDPAAPIRLTRLRSSRSRPRRRTLRQSLRALVARKPGGIVLNYRTVAGWDYQAMTAAGGTYLVLKSTYTSYRKLSDKTPG
jgi:hypothetical protein